MLVTSVEILRRTPIIRCGISHWMMPWRRVGRQVRVVTTIPDVPVDTIGTVLAVSGGQRTRDGAGSVDRYGVPHTATRQTNRSDAGSTGPTTKSTLVEV